MSIQSYVTLSNKILNYLRKSQEIFIIDILKFQSTIILQYPIDPLKNLRSFSYFDFNLLSPQIVDNLNDNIDLINNNNEQLVFLDNTPFYFALELVASHEYSWLSKSAETYLQLEQISLDEATLDWMRYLKAEKSSCFKELALLSIDPDRRIRELAHQRIRDLKV